MVIIRLTAKYLDEIQDLFHSHIKAKYTYTDAKFQNVNRIKTYHFNQLHVFRQILVKTNKFCLCPSISIKNDMLYLGDTKQVH